MKTYVSTKISAEQIRRDFLKLGLVTNYRENVKLCAAITCLGIMREVGGPNNELARFIFNVDTGEVVAAKSLKAEAIIYNNLLGLKIYTDESSRIEVRASWFCDLIHPDFSFNDDGTIKCLVIFPEIISKIAQSAGAETVIVKRWATNTIFGGFDSSKSYYQTNFWELENNDTLLFADLTRNKKVAFLGTHDLIAHICGVKANEWSALALQAERVYQSISRYFKSVDKPSIASLILPYTIGVILDDLAQPPTYNSKSHTAFLEVLISRLNDHSIRADQKTILTEFPKEFANIITHSRDASLSGQVKLIEESVGRLIEEVQSKTFVFHS